VEVRAALADLRNDTTGLLIDWRGRLFVRAEFVERRITVGVDRRGLEGVRACAACELSVMAWRAD
jgi:hypothetical protein